MKKPGRKRSSQHLPAHISAEKLPDGVWFQATGAGHWIYNYYDEYHIRKTKKLCGAKATLTEIWQAVAAAQTPKQTATFTSLSTEFQQTRIWQKLSANTQKDYIDCHNAITRRDTSTGKLGDVPLNKWTVGLIRKYRDKRAEQSESRANKELSYIKRVFAWAYEYEKVTSNPATGIKKLTIPHRQHYPDDPDYYYLLNVAKQSNYWYVQYAMEIAYLCRTRMCEVVNLTDANELPEGLIIHRRKGSKTNITEWQPRLKAAWDAIKQKRNTILANRKQPHPIRPDMRYLFISERTGNKITLNGVKTAIQRINQQAEAQANKDGVNFTHFTFHDIKRKGISDTAPADRMASAGHRSPEMMNVYDVKPDVVKPTR